MVSSSTSPDLLKSSIPINQSVTANDREINKRTIHFGKAINALISAMWNKTTAKKYERVHIHVTLVKVFAIHGRGNGLLYIFCFPTTHITY